MFRTDVVSLYGPPIPTAFIDVIESWSSADVADWLQGLDDDIMPYIGGFVAADVDGRRLLMLTQDDLNEMGIVSFGLCKLVLQATGLLNHLCYNMDAENLQSLALCLDVRARNLRNEMCQCANLIGRIMRQPPANRSKRQIVDVLNQIFVGVSYLADETKPLISWLDRSPFDRARTFVTIRNRIMDLVVSMVKTVVNVPSRDMLQAPKKILPNCDALCEICDHIVRDLNEPVILYTAYFDRAILRKAKSTAELGIKLQSSYRGVHVISEIKLQSAADVSAKVDAGDEIIQINGQTVAGWELSKVAQRLSNNRASELVLLLKKRPREALATFGLKSQPATPKIAPKRDLPKTKISLDFGEPLNAARIAAKVRKRSSSMTTPKTPLCATPVPSPPADGAKVSQVGLFSPLNKRLPPWERDDTPQEVVEFRLRRATICGGSPMTVRWSVHLDRRGSTLRPQTEWFDKDWLDGNEENGTDEDYDDVFSTAYPEYGDDPLQIDFAQIDAIDPSEIEQLGISPVEHDVDWKLNRPRVTISSDSSFDGGPNTEANTPSAFTAGESQTLDSLMTGSLDSASSFASLPRESQMKLSKFFGENMPNQMSASLISGVQTLPRSGKMAFNAKQGSGSKTPDANYKGSPPSVFRRTTSEGPLQKLAVTSSSSTSNLWAYELRKLGETPCPALDGKAMESWVRRRRISGEKTPVPSGNSKNWLKRYMILKGNLLFIYESQLSIEAEAVVVLPGCTVCDAPELKSSKRYIFKLYREGWTFYFACFNVDDMKAWMNKLGLATIGYGMPAEELSRHLLPREYVYFPSMAANYPSSHSPPRNSIFGTGPRFRARKKKSAPNLGSVSTREGSMTSVHSGHSSDSTGTNTREIVDPLRAPAQRRRKPLPAEYLS